MGSILCITEHKLSQLIGIIPEDAQTVHLVANKKAVEYHNLTKLKPPIIQVPAHDIYYIEPADGLEQEECPLPESLQLCDGAIIMVVHHNLDVCKGVVNGALGTLEGVNYNQDQTYIDSLNILLLLEKPTQSFR
jgi:hypothetical protein